jgi:proteasome lid subunit RPN8/RPN11
MIVTDIVYEQVRTQLAEQAPERGGALYGPKGFPVTSHFEYDAKGATTSVSYVPSTALIDNVHRVERETGLQLKGIVHSHPKGYRMPSEGDRKTVQSFFRLNPHFSAMALPIVQPLDRTGCDENFLAWYRAERRGATSGIVNWLSDRDGPGVEIIPEEFHILPLWAHMAMLLEMLGKEHIHLECSKRVQHLAIQNAQLLGLVATGMDGLELMFFAPFDYPVIAPLVLYKHGKTTRSLKLHWDGMREPRESLTRLVEELLEAWSPVSREPLLP